MNARPAKRNDGPVFGIDLGTTNSCIARVAASGKAEVLENADQMLTTPSVVAFNDPKAPVVGLPAKRLAAVMPEAVCMHIKRKMGMGPDHPDAMTALGGRTFSPEEISALILRKVVNDALAEIGEPQDTPVRAVITVPAYFGVIPKNATKNAARLAGIELLDLIHEPVAAAISYGFAKVDSPVNILVYDLGGGTFDATVVRADGGSVRTVATDGERLLGGLDWDEVLVDWLRHRFEERYPEFDHGFDDPRFRRRLFENAEQAKMALSQMTTTSISLHQGDKSLSVELARDAFEQLTADKLELTIAKTEAVLAAAAAEKGIEKIHQVLLVGGSSKMPCVARRLAEVAQLRRLEAQLYEPDLAVAKGAALLADKIVTGQHHADLTGKERASHGRLVTMVNAKAIGTVLQSHSDPSRQYVHYMIPRNAELPVSVEETFYTVVDNQKGIQEKIVEERGEPSEEIEENTVLHDRGIELPISLPANSPLNYRYTLDGAGILHVFITEPASGKTWEMEVNRFTSVSNDDILRLRPVISAVI